MPLPTFMGCCWSINFQKDLCKCICHIQQYLCTYRVCGLLLPVCPSEKHDSVDTFANTQRFFFCVNTAPPTLPLLEYFRDFIPIDIILPPHTQVHVVVILIYTYLIDAVTVNFNGFCIENVQQPNFFLRLHLHA